MLVGELTTKSPASNPVISDPAFKYTRHLSLFSMVLGKKNVKQEQNILKSFGSFFFLWWSQEFIQRPVSASPAQAGSALETRDTLGGLVVM